MVFSCCTTIDNYELLKSKGYDRIILSATELVSMDEKKFELTKEKIKNGKVKCHALNNFCYPEIKLCGDGYKKDAIIDYGKKLAQRASKIGIKYIGVGSPKSRNISPEISKTVAKNQFMESIETICDICRPYNIDVLLEAVCSLECNFITRTDEALFIVKELATDNLGLVFDTYHAFMMGEDSSPLERAIEYVKLVHVAQDINGQRHYLRKENINEYKVYINTLLKHGFDGEIGVEAFYDNIEEQLTETLMILKQLTIR